MKMTKENKCISLPLAKELQQVAEEKGFRLPESELVYINETLRFHRQDNLYNPIPAYDTAELGEILKEYDLECIWFEEKNKFGAFQTCSSVKPQYADTEADARGKLLVFLIKNNLIK